MWRDVGFVAFICLTGGTLLHPSAGHAEERVTQETIQEREESQQGEEKRANEAVGSDEPLRLDSIIVTATRGLKKALDAPYTVNTIPGRDIQNRILSRTVPESLQETPGVMVQKTARGQGSPYIRGFTGFRTLCLIDGIRLNNSVFRDGPNQYWNTIDPFSLDKIEIVKGPSSVLYGSDAIGGTAQALTGNPVAYEGEATWESRLHYRFASADQSNVGRAEVSGAPNEWFGFLVGGTIKDFDDLRAGGDVGVQDRTGYDEWDGDAKMTCFLSDDLLLVASHQEVHQDDAWRAHKTVYGVSWEGTTVGNEQSRVMSQDRQLSALQLHGKSLDGWVDSLDLSLSYQRQEEERDRVKSDWKGDLQGVDVGTLGSSVQVGKSSPVGQLTCGMEWYHDDVASFSKKFRSDGSLSGIGIQGPVADDATYDLLGTYVQDEIPVLDRLDLALGTRYTYAAADADQVEDPETGNEISLSEHWDDLSCSGRLIYDLAEDGSWKVFGGISQGFRSPNLSDLTRLDTARSDEIETPSPGLDPERFLSHEIGIKALCERVSVQAAYYYTDIDDMIVRTPTQEVIDDLYEVTKKNAGDGFVQGFEVGAAYKVHSQWTVFGDVSWMEGEVEGYPTSSQDKEGDYISRLMPPTGHLGVRWEDQERRCWVEALCAMAAKQDKLSLSDQRDTQRIPPGGTPGYAVLSLRGGWEIRDGLTLSTSLENVTDEDYRIHGSGQNEPGLNCIVALDWRF